MNSAYNTLSHEDERMMTDNIMNEQLIATSKK